MTARAKGLPVDVYVRVSRKGPRADERFHSPEEQEQLARGFAESRGLRVGVVLPPDIDKSGGTVDRAGLHRALERVRAGESQGIVVAWIDRFSRDAAQAYDLLRAFEEAGGRVYAPEAPEDVSTPEGELQLGMFLLVAQYQRKRARAGFERAKSRAVTAGIAVGRVNLGYRQRDDRRLEVDPETAPVVRELYERRAGGAGYGELAEVLSGATGRTWTRQAVAAILRNRLYATGQLEYGGVVSDWNAGALVDEPTWHAAQSATPGPRPARGGGWLLTGLLRCATCGHALAPWTGSKRRRQDPRRGKMDWVEVKNPPRRYRCPNRACEDRASVDATQAERLAVLQSFAAGDELETRASAPDLSTLEKAVAVAERRLEQVLAPEARDALGELWAADVRDRREERGAALAQLGEARQAAGVEARELRLRDAWDGMTPADRRKALALFWRELRVGPRVDEGRRSVTFVARGPLGEAEVELPG